MPGLVGRDRGVGSAGPFSEVPQGKARVGSGPLEEAGSVHKNHGIRSDTMFGLPEMRGVSPRPPMGVHSRAQGTEQHPDIGRRTGGISGRARGSGKLRKPRPGQGLPTAIAETACGDSSARSQQRLVNGFREHARDSLVP